MMSHPVSDGLIFVRRTAAAESLDEMAAQS
jgi:hypothetical protein